MQKYFTVYAVNLLLAGMFLSGIAIAQDAPAPAATPQPPQSSAKMPAATAKSRTATSAKTGARTGAPLALKTKKEKFSYALGMNIGSNLHKQSVPVDPTILARGVRDALAGGKMLLTEDEARAALTAVQSEMRQKQQEKMQEASVANKKEGEEFLTSNKAKEGVTVLPSGLQYKVLKQGTGPKPAATDTVVCNYRGTLLNGTEFDNSSKHGGSATFPVNGVIKGWTEALQLMPVGSKWQLFIPSDLAYGDRGAGGDITPGATLIFEVELMSIQSQDKSQEKDKAPEKAPDQK